MATVYETKKQEIGGKRSLKLGNEGSRGNVLIGKWTYYGDSQFNGFHPSDFLYIANFCSIATDVKFFLCNGNHFPERVANYPIDSFFHEQQTPVHKNFTTIGNDVWIGASAIILPGIKIGNGAIIGAGSVVTKDVEDFAIVAGNPAKVIGKRFSDETINLLQNIAWWNWSDEKIKEHRELFLLKEDEIKDYIVSKGLIRDKGVPAYYIEEIIKFFDSDMTSEELSTKVKEFLYQEDVALRMFSHKTQSFENLCVWMAAFIKYKPKTLVEFGTQTGCSSSIFKRMTRFLGLDTKIITINIADELVYREEGIEYVIEDFTGKVGEIWDRWNPDFVFQDAHMYSLVEDQLKESETKHRNTVHFFHDVGHRLFQNPMTIEKHEVPTSATGSWERHVIADLYAPSLLEVSSREYEDDNVRTHIFDGCADINEFGLEVLTFK